MAQSYPGTIPIMKLHPNLIRQHENLSFRYHVCILTLLRIILSCSDMPIGNDRHVVLLCLENLSRLVTAIISKPKFYERVKWGSESNKAIYFPAEIVWDAYRLGGLNSISQPGCHDRMLNLKYLGSFQPTRRPNLVATIPSSGSYPSATCSCSLPFIMAYFSGPRGGLSGLVALSPPTGRYSMKCSHIWASWLRGLIPLEWLPMTQVSPRLR